LYYDDSIINIVAVLTITVNINATKLNGKNNMVQRVYTQVIYI